MARELNTHDGWESVVNDPDRQERIDRFHAKRKADKLNRLSAKVLIFVVMTIVFGLFGITGALVNWISTPAAIICGALACFNFGRYAQLRGW